MNTPLFANLPLIAERIAASAHLLLGLDYDGSLTLIVDDPSRAWLHTDVRDTLGCLAQHPATTVAVISGRALNDVRTRVGLATLVYAGNHGLDIQGPAFRFAEPTALREKEELQLLSHELTAELSAIQGAAVEDKSLTLSVHFRRVDPSQHNDVRRIVEATIVNKTDRFLLRMGNHVCEVRPNVEWNKGTAVCWISDRLEKPGTLVLYLGDDSTDEDAFLALREHITVKVGDPTHTSAHYHLEGPAEVKAFLEWLAQVRGNEARP